MSKARETQAKRIKLSNIAEREINRFKDNHKLWHLHIHNVTLDPAQVLKCKQMDENDYTIDYSCRRTGKTAIKELYNLWFLATHSDQELGIVAPREAQSITNLNYQLDAIRRSQILTNYIGIRSGRKTISDTYFKFRNRSKAAAYGIMAQVDGGDLTIASLEEVDDMPKDRLTSRFLLMLGANRRLGASNKAINKPQIRITGVFKGADTLAELIDNGLYATLQLVDCNLGIIMGLLNETFIEDMRAQLSGDEFLRQMLCRNVSGKNLIWEKHIRKAMQTGLESGINLAGPLPGIKYKKKGLISFGYDHLGHGENVDSSQSALVVAENVSGYTCFIYAKTWEIGADEAVIENDLFALWSYFNPDYAIGDAYGIGLLTSLNDRLYRENLITEDRRIHGDGKSTASTWKDWKFSPLRFEGMVKHSMATSLRQVFHNGKAVLVYIDDENPRDALTYDYRTFTRQLGNMIAKKNKTYAYDSYVMVDAKIKDDLFDAAIAANYALVTAGGLNLPSIIKFTTRTREDLLNYS